MKAHPWLILALAAVLAEVAVYFLNPLHTASTHVPMRLFGIDFYRQRSQAMLPSMAAGDLLMASAWSDTGDAPKVADIVVFRYPPDPSVSYVKRIIATGGQTLEIRDCTVFLDGRPLIEPYVERARAQSPESCGFGRVQVPASAYMVLGDNRDQSADSRQWGFVPRDHIIGKVLR